MQVRSSTFQARGLTGSKSGTVSAGGIRKYRSDPFTVLYFLATIYYIGRIRTSLKRLEMESTNFLVGFETGSQQFPGQWPKSEQGNCDCGGERGREGKTASWHEKNIQKRTGRKRKVSKFPNTFSSENKVHIFTHFIFLHPQALFWSRSYLMTSLKRSDIVRRPRKGIQKRNIFTRDEIDGKKGSPRRFPHFPKTTARCVDGTRSTR